MLYCVEDLLSVLDLLLVSLTNFGVLPELLFPLVIISYRHNLLSKSCMLVPPFPQLVKLKANLPVLVEQDKHAVWVSIACRFPIFDILTEQGHVVWREYLGEVEAHMG